MIPLVLLFIHCLNALADPTNALPQAQNANPASSPTFLFSDTQIISTRSRSDIIWNCFATVFACTWVAVHPNVPAPTDSEWKILRHRLKIMVYTLLVPELVLYWASKQWYAASQAAKKHQDKGWTKTHGFFIGMGGLLLSEEGNRTRPLDMEYLEDAVDLGTMEWPNISEEDILDKSKSDYFSKGVVLLQTGWFIVQCVARAIAHLSLTELELATLAYAVLSGAMYFFWWNKPLDVRWPIVIYTRNAGNLEFISSRNSGELNTGRLSTLNSFGTPDQRNVISQRHRQSTLRRSHSLSSLALTNSCLLCENPDTSCMINKSDNSPDLAHIRMHQNPTFLETTAKSESIFFMPSSAAPPPPTRPVRSSHYLPKQGTKKQQMRCLLFLVYPFQVFINDCVEMRESGTLLSNRMSPFYAGVRLELRHALSILLFLLGTIFGAIHCIAWSFEFPSIVEKWMWRVTAAGIAILPSMIAINYLITIWLLYSSPFLGLGRVRLTFTFSLSGICLLLGRFLETTSVIRLSVLFGFYIISRIFLLVLPLIELRSLPSTSYQSIDWLGFIPHL